MRTPRRIVMGAKAPAKQQRAREFRGSPTPAEDLLWSRLRRNQLAGLHFRRQQVIDGLIVDFYCHVARLVVEVDGPVHLLQQDYDRDREAVLKERGLRVLRFSNDRVLSDTKAVLDEIREAPRT